MSKKCPSCGFKNDNSASACTNCGGFLDQVPGAAPSASEPASSVSVLPTSQELATPSSTSTEQESPTTSSENGPVDDPPSFPIVVTRSVGSVLVSTLPIAIIILFFGVGTDSLLGLLPIIAIVAAAVASGFLSRYLSTFHFFEASFKVRNKEFSYSDLGVVQQYRKGLLLGIKGKNRGMFVPSNPVVGSADLFSWLKTKVPSAPTSVASGQDAAP